MTKKTLCCPEFNISKYDNKTEVWENKMFIKDSMKTFFHIPNPKTISKKIGKMWEQIEEYKAFKGNNEDYLILFKDPSAFRSEIFMLVDKALPDYENIELSGKFYSRVYDGPYKDTGKFFKEFQKELKEKGLKPFDFYSFSPYCPSCAKEYGHNYQVLFAELEK